VLVRLRQIGTRGKVLVHADRAFGFAAAAKQRAEREVQLGGFRIERATSMKASIACPVAR
jgi:hypothetical protein